MGRASAWHAAAAWVREHGGQVQGVAFDGARDGVQADGDLSVGSCVLRIPMRLCVTGREARASPVGRAAKDAATAVEASTAVGSSLSRSTDDLVLAFHLAADVSRGPSAFHAPYYATLPIDDDDPRCMLPRSWSDAELQSLLGGSPSVAEAHRARAAVHADYAAVSASARQLTVHGALPDAWPSFDAFDWATAIVASRCFVLEEAAGGGGSIEALVPLVDMLNHARPRQSTYCVVDGTEADPTPALTLALTLILTLTTDPHPHPRPHPHSLPLAQPHHSPFILTLTLARCCTPS